MEGELSISKIFLKSYVLFLILSIILVGCKSKEIINIQGVKLLVTSGGWGSIPCVLEVSTDGKLEVICGDGVERLFYEWSSNKDFFDIKRCKHKVINLSKKQIKEIDILISKIKNDAEKINDSYDITMDAVEIHAIINDVNCSSLLNDYDLNMEPNALQQLTYRLLDISNVNLRR